MIYREGYHFYMSKFLSFMERCENRHWLGQTLFIEKKFFVVRMYNMFSTRRKGETTSYTILRCPTSSSIFSLHPFSFPSVFSASLSSSFPLHYPLFLFVPVLSNMDIDIFLIWKLEVPPSRLLLYRKDWNFFKSTEILLYFTDIKDFSLVEK